MGENTQKLIMKLSLAIFAVASAQQEIYGTCGDSRCDGACFSGLFGSESCNDNRADRACCTTDEMCALIDSNPDTLSCASFSAGQAEACAARGTVVVPTDGPTDSPDTDSPTDDPTQGPTDTPTDSPTDSPTDTTADTSTDDSTDAVTDGPSTEPAVTDDGMDGSGSGGGSGDDEGDDSGAALAGISAI